MQIKGSVLVARTAFLDVQGPEVVARVLDRLSAPTRAAIEKQFMPNAWYPVQVHNELVQAMDEEIGTGDGQLCHALGRHSCEQNLTTIYRVFLRVGGIHIMLRRVAQGWKVHYDAGKLTVTEKRSKGVTLQLEDVPKPSQHHCLPVFAWCQRAAELAGCDNVIAKVRQCRRRGHDACVFEYDWE